MNKYRSILPTNFRDTYAVLEISRLYPWFGYGGEEIYSFIDYRCFYVRGFLIHVSRRNSNNGISTKRCLCLESTVSVTKRTKFTIVKIFIRNVKEFNTVSLLTIFGDPFYKSKNGATSKSPNSLKLNKRGIFFKENFLLVFQTELSNANYFHRFRVKITTKLP